MTIRFKTLFSITVTHEYYGGDCDDLGFVTPGDAARVMRGGRLMGRLLGRQYRIAFEADEDGQPLARLTGGTLRIGLRLLNPNFTNFTAISFDPRSTVAVYRNAGARHRLDSPLAATRIGQVFTHPLVRATRPVTVALKNSMGETVSGETIATDDLRASVSIDLGGHAAGTYVMEETYPGDVVHSTTYYFDADLLRNGVFGIVEITIDDAFYTTPPAFEIPFAAREDTLNYYLVTRNYPNGDFNQLAVLDAGFTAEGRSEVKFTRVEAAGFGPADLPVDLLGPDDAKVALFRSQALVRRRVRGHRKIQLKKNGEVLVEHLPQPAADRADGDVIVHLSKL